MLALRGTELDTIEVGGTIAPACVADVLARSGLVPESSAQGVRVSLLLFRLRGLHLRGLPWPSFSYGEALWRIGVRHGERAAWLAIACDLDSLWIRVSGAWLVRYPVRRARLTFSSTSEACSVEVEGAAGSLSVRAVPTDHAPAAEPPRPLLVQAPKKSELYRIPWQEEPAPYRRRAELSAVTGSLAEATFGGPVRWDAGGLVHHGRIHCCGLARRA